jgi:glycosyltransferase involved in cell wall biosynthesis
VIPLVTIGIPTYNRPQLLARALAAVAKQDYPNIEVLVADNATPGAETGRVVDAYRRALRRLTYVKHERGIGPRDNFMYLLQAATGRYFMWLADDDEITANYVSSLVALLESDATAASAMGHWRLMQNEQDGRLMPTSSYPERSALARALRFIWRSDDAFFYALHRTDVLRQASFRGYWWPNRAALLNWAYVYLLDVVLRGRVLIARDPSVQFINHDYTQKSYATTGRSLPGFVATACRRINMHYLYWEKCTRLLPPLTIPAVVATSVASLLREGGGSSLRRARRTARRLR